MLTQVSYLILDPSVYILNQLSDGYNILIISNEIWATLFGISFALLKGSVS